MPAPTRFSAGEPNRKRRSRPDVRRTSDCRLRAAHVPVSRDDAFAVAAMRSGLETAMVSGQREIHQRREVGHHANESALQRRAEAPVANRGRGPRHARGRHLSAAHADRPCRPRRPHRRLDGEDGPRTGSGKSRGHTLYLFGKDRKGKSACSGQCATFWPPLIASGKPGVAGGAKASLIGAIKRADGRRQGTYNHHPLYTFVKDKQKGQTKGEGVNAFGAKWYAVSPSGAKVLRKPAANGIPQHNGGDHDSDNNGGPSDGDGNI